MKKDGSCNQYDPCDAGQICCFPKYSIMTGQCVTEAECCNGEICPPDCCINGQCCPSKRACGSVCCAYNQFCAIGELGPTCANN